MKCACLVLLVLLFGFISFVTSQDGEEGQNENEANERNDDAAAGAGIGATLSNIQMGAINKAQALFMEGLEELDPDDPKALIQLQILAFLFTNTVQSVSGSLQSVSSATQAAAQRILP